jgi:thiol-disulfide isomerase/thioredoxin
MRKRLSRTLTLVLAGLLATAPAWSQLVSRVRSAASAGDFARGEQLIESYRQARGVTPEMILALSWLGRGAQAAGDWNRAERYAGETRRLALAELARRGLDADEELPLALGASIEVQAHALAARQARSEALLFLDQELKRWGGTSIRARIQKNIHLLSLAGQPAPQLDVREYVGARPRALAELRGRPVLLFFWAHWCSDCKQQAAVLKRLQQEFGPRGLVLIGPTQRYGYTARGADATPEQELAYIAEVRRQHYARVEMSVPVSEENFKTWGASTTPTLALVDRSGVVRLYHPGQMPFDALAPQVARLLEESGPR